MPEAEATAMMANKSYSLTQEQQDSFWEGFVHGRGSDIKPIEVDTYAR